MNPNLQFRVDRVYTDVSGVMDYMFKTCEQGFAFEHPKSSTKDIHIHGYMFNPSIVAKSLRGKVKAKLSLKPNDYEVSDRCKGPFGPPVDMSGAYAYGSKFDTIAPSFLKNISPDLLEQLRLHARNEGIKMEKQVEANVDKMIKAPKKDHIRDTYFDMCESVWKEARNTPGIFQNKLFEDEDDFGHSIMTCKEVCVKPRVVYDILLKHLRRNRMVVEVHQMTRFMTTILREDPKCGLEIKKAVFARLNL